MKKLILSILLSNLICVVFSQNHTLDLSNGGVSIGGVDVDKINTYQFVIISDSPIAISHVILNAGTTDIMKVKDTAFPEVEYSETTTNYTEYKLEYNLSSNSNDTLKLFVFENSHNYIIEHNKKTWDIIVRKKKSPQTDIFLEDKNLHIGDSCVVLQDTMRITLNDSLTLSKWDRGFSLSKNGIQLKDTLCKTADDSCFYYYKASLSSDLIIHANDTLSIKKLSDNRSYLVIFEKTDEPHFNYWWLLLLLLIIPALYVIKKRKIIIAWFKKKIKVFNQVPMDNPNSNDSKANKKQECLRQLNKLLDELYKILPEKINGFDKKKMFVQKDNIDGILRDLTIVKAIGNPSLLKKCDEIRQFVDDNLTILADNPSPTEDSESVNPQTSEKNDISNANSEPDWFADILSTIESLKFESNDKRKEGLSHSTIERIKADFLSLSTRIQNELRIAKEQGNEEISRSWQIRYDDLEKSYNELKNSYNRDVQAAADEAKRTGEESLSEAMKELEKKANDAEEKAQKVEESKKNAIAEAVQKEKDSVAKEMERLKIEKQAAIDKAEAVEESKNAAIAAAVKKEQEYHLKEEKKLRECKEKAEADLTRTIRSLETTQKELKDTKTDRDNRINKIQQLEKAQEQFTRSLSSVPFAEIYSKQIHELLKLGSQIQTTAYSILDSNVEDPYFIMKAIFKYGKMTDSIDMETFLTDINMVSRAKFVFKDSSLATFKEDNQDIDSIVRSYFFNQYLEKYINAIMVLNESMSGLKLLLPEVQSKVTSFDKYREELLLLAKKLKVSVLYVKVGDMAGENIDLKAKAVDVEIGKPGQILEIENCIVYLSDCRKPNIKIKVTIKK